MALLQERTTQPEESVSEMSTPSTTLANGAASSADPQAPSTDSAKVLLDLPTELLENICEFIPIGSASESGAEVRRLAMGTFHALCLSCKDLFVLARPLLYRTVQLDLTPSHYHYSSSRRLARTLCACPHLGLLIRLITAKHQSEYSLRTWLPSHYFRMLIHRNQVCIEQDRPHFENVLSTELFNSLVHPPAGRPRYEDMAALVVVRMAPRVQTIILPTGDNYYYALGSYWGRLLRMLWSAENLANLPQGCFAQLHHVELNAMAWKEIDRINPINRPREHAEGAARALPAAMQLPELRRLTVKGMRRDRSFNDPQPLGKGTSSVQFLTFLQSNVVPEALIAAVQTCKALREFHYEVRVAKYHSYTTWDREWTDPLVIYHALGHHCDTLQSITITNLANHGEVWVQRAFDNLFLPSNFPQLIELEIDAHLLLDSVGLSSLPAKLEKLTVHTYSDVNHLGSVLLRLAAHRGQGLQDLKITVPNAYRQIVDLDDMYGPLHKRVVWTENSERRFKFDFESYAGGKRLTLTLWEFQAWAVFEVQALGTKLWCGGLDDLIEAQRPNVWEHVLDIGDDLSAMLNSEGKE
ncbi:unnamed protein product [Zymoseptoria tritici ST99CH_3D7]|uniref:Uncharacterized protein n=1 Tax=Zymoseptoria tritici (strain ST99CH_3D7) TaxID=1276538 RepID=A0A1X7S2J1_ZYMT9|nr:unnamed protein product [Zymoseptoria tritici ST99CH_3D7]